MQVCPGQSGVNRCLCFPRNTQHTDVRYAAHQLSTRVPDEYELPPVTSVVFALIPFTIERLDRIILTFMLAVWSAMLVDRLRVEPFTGLGLHWGEIEVLGPGMYGVRPLSPLEPQAGILIVTQLWHQAARNSYHPLKCRLGRAAWRYQRYFEELSCDFSSVSEFMLALTSGMAQLISRSNGSHGEPGQLVGV